MQRTICHSLRRRRALMLGLQDHSLKSGCVADRHAVLLQRESEDSLEGFQDR